MNENDRTTLEQAIYEEMELTPEMIRSIRTLCGVCLCSFVESTDQFIWESPKTGLPCNPTHFRDVFRKSLEEAGDVRLLTPHSCRHTYVSQMQALGVDIQTIQSIVGHADTEMTEHYLHVQESIRQSAIQLFSEAFSA